MRFLLLHVSPPTRRDFFRNAAMVVPGRWPDYDRTPGGAVRQDERDRMRACRIVLGHCRPAPGRLAASIRHVRTASASIVEVLPAAFREGAKTPSSVVP